MRVRRIKLDRLRATGIDPFPSRFFPDTSMAAVRTAHPRLPSDTHTGDEVRVAGRVMLNRDNGRLIFATLQDVTDRLQVMLAVDLLGAPLLARWRQDIDLGDHVGVVGEVITTRRGELSVAVRDWVLTAKCLRPLPEKHRALAHAQGQPRLRHMDLTRPAARDMLRLRSSTLGALRDLLRDRDYLEVETPMLRTVHGGANAQPFVTHINASGMRLYLRVTPELYLKRLIVGGEERVFELSRNFRNEGADATHNPEFTVLEAYQTYSDYATMLTLMREMIQTAATAAFGTPVARRAGPDGIVSEVNMSGGWRECTVNGAISGALGEAVDNDTPREVLAKLCDAAGITYHPTCGRGALVLHMYEHLVEKRTVEPTFFKDFPTDVARRARQHGSTRGWQSGATWSRSGRT